MKYTNEEAFAEIMKRGRVLKREHEKKVTRLLSAAAGAVMTALILLIGVFGSAGAGMQQKSTYGSLLLPTEAGGYVLASVIAFAVGVIVALAIQRIVKKHHK